MVIAEPPGAIREAKSRPPLQQITQLIIPFRQGIDPEAILKEVVVVTGVHGMSPSRKYNVRH
jgi:hypothetical protein